MSVCLYVCLSVCLFLVYLTFFYCLYGLHAIHTYRNFRVIAEGVVHSVQSEIRSPFSITTLQYNTYRFSHIVNKI